MTTPPALSPSSMGYIFTFDLKSDTPTDLIDTTTQDRFKDFASTVYTVGGELRDYGTERNDHSLVRIYKQEMYDRRYRRAVLTTRRTMLFEFRPQYVSGLLHTEKALEVVSPGKALLFRFTATVNQLGVASLVMWLDLGNPGALSFEHQQALRDIPALKTQIDWRVDPAGARLHGLVSLLDIARFAILLIYSALYETVDLRSIRRQIDGGVPLERIHRDTCELIRDQPHISHEIDCYPIFHVDLTADESATGAPFRDRCESSLKQVRGLLVGDENWDKKKQEVLNDFKAKNSFSTRESIVWFTHPNGSMKIYSKDLETPLQTSKVLITFELEILLTMRHFIYKVIRNLNYFSNLRSGSFPLRSVARLRNREMRRLDEYYNLDLLEKDTTIDRLARFRKLFRIDELLDIAVKKFDSLNTYMNTEFQDAAARRQVALTVIFGAFSAGSFVFAIVRKAVEDRLIGLRFSHQLAIAAVAMAGVAAAIIARYRTVRMR